MPASAPGSHLHLMTRKPGIPDVNVSGPLDIAGISGLLREADLRTWAHRSGRRRALAAIARRGSGWVAVASCTGDCAAVAARVAARAEAPGPGRGWLNRIRRARPPPLRPQRFPCSRGGRPPRRYLE